MGSTSSKLTKSVSLVMVAKKSVTAFQMALGAKSQGTTKSLASSGGASQKSLKSRKSTTAQKLRFEGDEESPTTSMQKALEDMLFIDDGSGASQSLPGDSLGTGTLSFAVAAAEFSDSVVREPIGEPESEAEGEGGDQGSLSTAMTSRRMSSIQGGDPPPSPAGMVESPADPAFEQTLKTEALLLETEGEGPNRRSSAPAAHRAVVAPFAGREAVHGKDQGALGEMLEEARQQGAMRPRIPFTDGVERYEAKFSWWEPAAELEPPAGAGGAGAPPAFGKTLSAPSRGPRGAVGKTLSATSGGHHEGGALANAEEALALFEEQHSFQQVPSASTLRGQRPLHDVHQHKHGAHHGATVEGVVGHRPSSGMRGGSFYPDDQLSTQVGSELSTPGGGLLPGGRPASGTSGGGRSRALSSSGPSSQLPSRPGSSSRSGRSGGKSLAAIGLGGLGRPGGGLNRRPRSA